MLKNAGHEDFAICEKLSAWVKPSTDGRPPPRRFSQNVSRTGLPTLDPRPGEIRVADSSPTQLRIHRSDDTDSEAQSEIESTSLEQLCEQFEAATGWPLRYVSGKTAELMGKPLWSAPLSSDRQHRRNADPTAAHLIISQQPKQGTSGRTSLEAITPLAESLTQLVEQLASSRLALQSREVELAASLPVVSRAEDAAALALRLTAVLQGGAEAVGCQAAGVYLLDSATTELKLRSAWGLPAQRLLEPARQLQGAIADLEALAGSAVVLDNAATYQMWQAPEFGSSYCSAVCVPVSSASTILGTLWMSCDADRDFTEQQTNLIEIIAGRIAVELEREALLGEGEVSIDLIRQFSAASCRQQGQLPHRGPEVDHLELQGSTQQAADLGGAFHDWFVLPDGCVTLTVGSTPELGAAAALTAQTVRTSIRAHAQHGADPAEQLGRTNQALWQGSAGDQFASAIAARIDPKSGRLEYAAAGQAWAVLLRDKEWEPLAAADATLGSDSDLCYELHEIEMHDGDVLVAWSAGSAGLPHVCGDDAQEQFAVVAESLTDNRTRACGELLVLAERIFEQIDDDAGDGAVDRSIVVLRHKPR